jgi:hypothetical protein
MPHKLGALSIVVPQPQSLPAVEVHLQSCCEAAELGCDTWRPEPAPVTWTSPEVLMAADLHRRTREPVSPGVGGLWAHLAYWLRVERRFSGVPLSLFLGTTNCAAKGLDI